MAIAKFLHDDVYKNGLGQFASNSALQLRVMNAVPISGNSGNLSGANIVASATLTIQEVTLDMDGSGGWQVKVASKTLTASISCTAGTALYIVITDHNVERAIKILMYTQETSGQGITIGASLIVPAFSFGFSAPV